MTNRSLRRLSLAGIMFLIVFGLVTGFVRPAAAGDARIAIVDFQRVLLESKRGQKARKEWEAEVEKRKKAFDKIQEEIKRLQEEYDRQGMLLTEKMKEQKEEELRNKLKDAQRRASDYQEEIKRLDQKLTRDILEDARKVVEDFAKNNNIDIILESTSVNPIYVGPNVDITDKVIAAYDKN